MPSSRFTAIPAELRCLPNWVLFKLVMKDNGKTDKIPYQINGNKASVTEPIHWATFEQAFNSLQFGGYDGLGFVFTNTEYTGIDLDDSKGDQTIFGYQLKIYNEFDSYSERSPSGNGCHIIVKGKVPSGLRKPCIELYPSGRFFTMTGDVVNNVPIAERSELLRQLWEQMGGNKQIVSYDKDEKETQSDEEVIKQARSAVNGDKFEALFSGDWRSLYQSQSEADFAFIDIVAFYTQNRNQITRIFRSSKLGTRDKAKREKYVSQMIQASFDRMPPSINFDGMNEAYEKIKAGSINGKSSPFDGDNLGSSPSPATNGPVAQRLEPTPHKRSDAGSNPAGTTIILPPGLLGDIAQFIYDAAPKPVMEIAIAGAIGFMAGICGKAYNVSDMGLNQYILMIAGTGKGKEAMAGGISKLINAVKLRVPAAPEFIGPSMIASKQGLQKWLVKNSSCFVSIIGEFGLTLKAMSGTKATSHQIELQAALLDIYHKSGYTDTYGGSAYSDQDKNSIAISAPAFSLLGESTPENFYSVLDEQMINSGLLPRFTIVEYNGPRVPSNDSKNIQPTFDLTTDLANLIAQAKTIVNNNSVIHVQFTPDALALSKSIDRYADDKINNTDKQFVHHLYNRAHIKALKLAAVIAVGVNHHNPLITVDYLNWAMTLVDNDIKSLSAKFESGEIGANTDELKQVSEAKRILKEYVEKDFEQAKKYGAFEDQYKQRVVNNNYLNRRMSKLAMFRNDRLGGTAALNRTMITLANDGYVIELKGKDLQKFNNTGRAYLIHPSIMSE